MDYLIVLVAAFSAGVLNTIAGGGTFLTFPALVYVGVPPIIANATSAVAVFPGYLGGALGFREEILKFDRKQMIKTLAITLSGALIGSLLLLFSAEDAFSFIIPFLLLGATLAFLFGQQIRTWAASKSQSITPYGALGTLSVGIYGGYFNGGLGIILLALFSLWGMTNVHQMNGLKSGLSFSLTFVSVIVFSLGGLVEWKYGLVMMVAALAGGYAGAPLARSLPKQVVRGLVGFIGFLMSGVFFWRYFMSA